MFIHTGMARAVSRLLERRRPTTRQQDLVEEYLADIQARAADLAVRAGGRP